MLSTGEYLTTNAYQNSDLFWALRGGGPGTYGIVTSVTYRTYPQVPIQIWDFQANITNSSVLPELVEGFLRYQTQITDAGWGGYGGVTNQGISFSYFAPNMTNETVTATTQPWVNYVQSLAPYGVVSSSQTTSDSWDDLIYKILYTSNVGGGGYVIVTSRLLSRDTVARNSSQVVQVLIDCSAGFKCVPFALSLFGIADGGPRSTIAGGRVSQFAADSAALNPAWRNAVTEAVCGVSWEEYTSTADIQALIQQLRGWIQIMYDATPNDGAYLNEVCHRCMCGRKCGSLIPTVAMLIGVPLRSRLAENFFRRALFDIEDNQRQV